ncbi:GTPase IMAP family member 5-like isoform X2 [Xyrauchen texanus]|uniref:GTPase IMAP family member 5-like isoform X1 n=1 Tax=Xyrauchen texanus TaxID=154827 RepID=UPI0022425179|nr:GTPase IMAP family member 5-like isoform X1 [Xyrauchen texanus]XP_051962446.1 GTPase IMAP family member 5-like isoform X2 [Xyrauchen texanus]
MAWRSTDGTNEARSSRDPVLKLRLMMLGGDEILMNQACDTILRITQRDDPSKPGIWQPMKAHVCGRQVSVLKTPPYWLQHLKSYMFFYSAVKSIKNDLEAYESLLFPGPHAFLLVLEGVNGTGEEFFLLQALSEVFGKAVLQYCMVLFMHEVKRNDQAMHHCVKMCGKRYHILQDSDSSVETLFTKIATMTESKESAFFTQHLECFRKAKKHFQMKFDAERKENENTFKKLLSEKEETMNNLRKEMDNMKEQNAKSVTESQDALRMSRGKERELNEELATYKDRESELRRELDVSRGRESELKDDKEKLQRDVEQLKDDVKELERNLREAKITKDFLEARLKSECSIIQHEEELQDKENKLHERQKELDRRETLLEARERDMAKREVHPSGSDYEHHSSKDLAFPSLKEKE